MDSTKARFVESVINGTSLLETVAANSTNPPAPTGISGGSLTSAAFSPKDIDNLPDSSTNSFMLTLDGNPPPDQIILDTKNVPDPKVVLATQLKDMAARIQKAVRAINSTTQPWVGFTCQATADNKLVLTSGTQGSKSSVAVSAAAQHNIVNKLYLDSGTTPASGKDATVLAGGQGSPFDINSNPEIFFLTKRSYRVAQSPSGPLQLVMICDSI